MTTRRARMSPALLTILLLLVISGPAIFPQSLPPLEAEGEMFDTLPDLSVFLKNITRQSPVQAVTFSPDGTVIASAHVDHTIRLWDTAAGNHFRTLTGHTDAVSSIDFNENGNTMVSGSWDKTIRLWNTDTGELLKTLEGHTQRVTSVSFRPNGETIVSGSWDDTIRLWNADTGELLRTLHGHVGDVSSVSFSRDGDWIVSGSFDFTVHLWDAEKGYHLASMPGHSRAVNAVSFHPDCKRVVSASVDKTVRLWDMINGQPLKTLQVHTNPVLSVTVSPDGNLIASGADDNTIHLWNAATGKFIKTLQGQTGPVMSLDFSRDGKWMVSGSSNGAIHLWDANTGSLIHTLRGYTHRIHSVKFNGDGKTMSTATWGNLLHRWDTATGRLLSTQQGITGRMTARSVSPDGKTTAETPGDGTIRLYENIGEDRWLSRIMVPGTDGNWLVIDTKNNMLWRRDDGTLLTTLDETGRMIPFPPPEPHQKGTLEIISKPTTLETRDGETTDFLVTLRNTGQGPIYWTRIITDRAGEAAGASETGKNPLVFHPSAVHMVLEPGQITDLAGKVSAMSPYTNPSGQTAKLYLKIMSVHDSTGAPLKLEIPVTVTAPELQLRTVNVRLQANDLLLVRVQSMGAQALDSETEFSVTIGKNTLPKLMVERINTGVMVELPFRLPSSLKIDNTTVINVRAVTTSFPLHEWTFENIPIAGIHHASPWPLRLPALLIILATIARIYMLRQRNK